MSSRDSPPTGRNAAPPHDAAMVSSVATCRSRVDVPIPGDPPTVTGRPCAASARTRAVSSRRSNIGSGRRGSMETGRGRALATGISPDARVTRSPCTVSTLTWTMLFPIAS